jgi:hypothetical protein
MRQGILYDMLGRFHQRDMRDATVVQFMKRYHVDTKQARRTEMLALGLLRQFSGDLEADAEYPRTCCPGRLVCTRSVCWLRTPATTSTPRISSPMPICRASRRWNRRISLCSCSPTAAPWRR